MNEVRWIVDKRTNSKAAGGGMKPTVGVGIDRPAPTVTSKSGGQWVIRPEGPEWAYDNPATTLVGSFCPDVIAAPGYRTATSRQNAEASIKVTAAEASILQGFRRDYPWHGSNSAVFQQIGNSVPPVLAMVVGAAVSGQSIPDGATA